ncbi:NAD-dependent epimerase/dehydratase family protein [Novosphingobium sp. fls2-241-R2A-195]|uniref:NAD-dependent epimerase/dehydratase family protein n=1 Tax=Novosphingobium sp. fls2-241-R2A-195 TaxID=3040296 RepID=UPI0033064E1B
MIMVDRTPVRVTGGVGYIGSHVVRARKDAGCPVIGLDNLANGFRFAVPGRAPVARIPWRTFVFLR